MNYLIIGNGIAGLSAATEIRKRDAAGAITMIGAEKLPCYSRVRLIDYLAGSVSSEKLILKKKDWYDSHAIACLVGEKAERIDIGQSLVVGASGREYPFDRLLLATGATSFAPPIAGYPKEGVFTLRTLADADRIRNAARTGEVVLLGGGVLGLEAGHALLRAGARITVVEMCDRLLPRQLDREGSAMLRRRLEKDGCQFRLGTKAAQLTGGDRVDGVVLERGERLPAATVVISAGIMPDTALAASAGIAVERGIVVNRAMATSQPGIYAAGDCACLEGRSYGLWPVAMAQGTVAGANMAGGDEQYAPQPPSNILKVAGVDLLSVGDIDPDGSLQSFCASDPDKGIYRKLTLAGGRAVGAILYGDLSGRREIMAAIANAATLTEQEAGDLARLLS